MAGLFFKYQGGNRGFFLMLLLLFFYFLASAQQLIVKNFNLRDGLPSKEVYCAFQDSKGFIWFGSDGGVSKFNGYTFKNYTTENGLSDNVVFGINEDRHGRIWFRSLSGKLSYIENDSVYNIGANDYIFQNIHNTLMTSIYIDKGDTIWCGLRAASFYLKIAPGYQTKNVQCVKVNCGLYFMEIEDGNHIFGNGFYFLKSDCPIITFYEKNECQNKISMPNINNRNVNYNKLSRNTYLVTDFEKLFLIKQKRIDTLLNVVKTFDSEPILLKKQGNYSWMGLRHKGVLECEEDDKLTWKKTRQFLSGYSVSDVMVDKEGGTWFTTLENGIYYSAPAHFLSYQNYTESLSSAGYNITRVGKDNFLVSYKSNKVDIVSSEKISRDLNIRDDRVKQLLESTSAPTMVINVGNSSKPDSFLSYLWIKEKHNLYELKDSIKFNPKVFFYANNSVTDKAYLFNRFWLYSFNKSNQQFKIIKYVPFRTFSVYQDKKEIIWLGCINGLWSFEKDKFIYHGNENDLLKSAIEDIQEGRDGTRYYATRGNGIIICKNGQYSKITTANGLISNNCKCLYIDEENTIWVGSKNGICKVSKDKNEWHSLKLDLTDNELSFEVLKIEKTKNKLWLYTNKGLLSYDLDNNETEFPPRIYLTQFYVNEISHLKDSTKVFTHDENSIKISYIGLSYQSMGKMSYAYKLEGLDTAWHTTQNLSIQYSYLPPGNYKLYVKAITFGGTEGKNQASVSFIINKPFWKTGWFITLSIMVISTIIGFIFNYQLNQVKKREREKTLFNKKLSELEVKALRSQMNPHFIFNSLNSIQQLIVLDEKSKARQYLSKFSKLLRKLLESSSYEHISLKDEVEILNKYLEIESLRFNNAFTYKVEIAEGVEAGEEFMPHLMIQPFVENSIWHGLLPKKGDKHVSILFEKLDETILRCTIDDNGIGIQAAQSNKSIDKEKSMALSLIQQRLEMYGKVSKNKYSVDIINKTDTSGNNMGTKVVVTMPLIKLPKE